MVNEIPGEFNHLVGHEINLIVDGRWYTNQQTGFGPDISLSSIYETGQSNAEAISHVAMSFAGTLAGHTEHHARYLWDELFVGSRTQTSSEWYKQSFVIFPNDEGEFPEVTIDATVAGQQVDVPIQLREYSSWRDLQQEELRDYLEQGLAQDTQVFDLSGLDLSNMAGGSDGVLSIYLGDQRVYEMHRGQVGDQESADLSYIVQMVVGYINAWVDGVSAWAGGDRFEHGSGNLWVESSAFNQYDSVFEDSE